MRLFKTRAFARFQRKERLSDAALRKAVRDAEAGLIDADLGHGLIKQRVARAGQGKRGAYRTVIAYRMKARAVILFGFAKNAKANLEPDELKELARRGAIWLAAGHDVIEAALADESLTEVHHGEDDED